MKISTCAIAAIASLLGVAQAAPLPNGGVTAQEIGGTLAAAGLPVQYSTDKDGDPLIKTNWDGVNTSIYFYECSGSPKRCKSFQFYSGFTTKSVPLAKLGEWNRTKRFGRAYLDTQGDPSVEMDVDAARGYSTEALANQLERWRLVNIEFAKYIGWNK